MQWRGDFFGTHLLSGIHELGDLAGKRIVAGAGRGSRAT
jgi:hypothetical protein